ncbi:hypothetical protein CRE_17306 [Caenorhabditis remanei]|uniref:Uncharacterized protein n=1 Tax=Caenorhabditis remanei TaxID=31234 RepID=E3MS16_CAERE|nr:hypothetical protein CRE_17306 [Caenorhabditis remanei]
MSDEDDVVAAQAEDVPDVDSATKTADELFEKLVELEKKSKEGRKTLKEKTESVESIKTKICNMLKSSRSEDTKKKYIGMFEKHLAEASEECAAAQHVMDGINKRVEQLKDRLLKAHESLRATGNGVSEQEPEKLNQ